MLIGYARVSTDEQKTVIQESALKHAGCEKIFPETASGGRWDRPQLAHALDQLRTGDVLVVSKLDPLSHSLKDLLTIMERIDQLGAGFRSLTEAIDTTTPAGRMMMQMIGSFGEFERSMIRERTKAGLESARKQGRMQEIVAMVTSGQKTAAETARLFKIHPATVSRLLALHSSK
ncbi:recombinase family protein [Glaciimonas sp. GG7]